MESGKSNFLIGLGVGSVIGALVYRFWHSPKGKCVKEKVNHAKLQISHENFPGKSNRKESEKLLTESICISWLEVNRNKLK